MICFIRLGSWRKKRLTMAFDFSLWESTPWSEHQVAAMPVKCVDAFGHAGRKRSARACQSMTLGLDHQISRPILFAGTLTDRL